MNALHYSAKRFFATLLFCCIGSPISGLGQELDVPVKQQLPLILKILTYDRHLSSQPGTVLRLGILHQSRVRSSLLVRNSIVDYFATQPVVTVGEKSVVLVQINATSNTDLNNLLSAHNVDVLYVAPLRAIDIEKIAEYTRSQQILTVTGVPDYIIDSRKLAVGVSSRGGKPHITINIHQARLEGADFSSQLLRLATIIEPETE
jgi:hypothetical protein